MGWQRPPLPDSGSMAECNDGPVTYAGVLADENGMRACARVTWLSVRGDISRCKHGLARHQTDISIERGRGTRDSGNQGGFHVTSIVFQHRSARIWKDGELSLFMRPKDCLKESRRCAPTSDQRQGVQIEALLGP